MIPFSIKEAEQYLEALRADGWVIKSKGDHFLAGKNRFKCTISCKEYPKAREGSTFSKGLYSRICMWGPDKLILKPPLPYSWKQTQKNLHLCDFCGKYARKVVRVAFVNRSCEKCAPAARLRLETPGWNK